MDGRRVVGGAVASAGVLLVVSPLAFLGLGLLYPTLTASSTLVVPFMTGWAITSILGFAALFSGIWVLDRFPSSHRSTRGFRRASGMRLAVISAVLMLVGFLVFAGFFAYLAGCHPVCTGGGGYGGNGPSYGPPRSCTNCASTAVLGPFTPLELLWGGVVSGLAAVTLAVAAVVRAIVAAPT